MFDKLFRRDKKAPQEVKTGRFEIERDGQVAYLEYTITGNILALTHSEVPEPLRGRGLASELAKSALDWARENHMRVDVVCPSVSDYLERHKEYSDLILR
jgi:predicted GNAT family acetyltransferase